MKLISGGIDWKNQIVAFIGTILGVVIALQLEEFQNDQQSQQRLDKTISNLDSEINKNLATMDSAYKGNERWIQYLNFYISKKVKNREILLTNHELDSIQKLLPSYFSLNTFYSGFKVKKIINDTVKLYHMPFAMAFNKPEISVDNWEATKASGVFLIMNPDQIVFYTKIYNQLESLNDPNVTKHYWAVRNVDSRNFENILKIDRDIMWYQIELQGSIGSIRDILKETKGQNQQQ